MKKLSLCLACLLFLCACATPSVVPSDDLSSGSNAPASTEEPTPESSTEPEPTPEPTPEPEPEESVLLPGATTTLGDWEVTVDSFEILDKIDSTYGSFTPDEGNKYIAANMTVKNLGEKMDTFYSSFSISNNDVRAKILYQDKYEYTATNLLGYDKGLHDESLNPLTKVSGVIAFSVVEEAAISGELVLVLTKGKETVTYEVQ